MMREYVYNKNNILFFFFSKCEKERKKGKAETLP